MLCSQEFDGSASSYEASPDTLKDWDPVRVSLCARAAVASAARGAAFELRHILCRRVSVICLRRSCPRPCCVGRPLYNVCSGWRRSWRLRTSGLTASRSQLRELDRCPVTRPLDRRTCFPALHSCPIVGGDVAVPPPSVSLLLFSCLVLHEHWCRVPDADSPLVARPAQPEQVATERKAVGARLPERFGMLLWSVRARRLNQGIAHNRL